MSENGHENVRKFLVCQRRKNLTKFHNFQNLKYSSESACPI